MSETLRKFGTESPSFDITCADCGMTWGEHSGHYCRGQKIPPKPIKLASPPVATQLERIEQGQSALLAALNELQADYKDWVCWRVELAGKLDGIRDGLAEEIGDTRKQILLLVSILHGAQPKQKKRYSEREKQLDAIPRRKIRP